jgi:hypothetical protein
MGKEINVWYDKEGDYLEVLFEKKGATLKKQKTTLLWKKSMRRGISSDSPFLK